MNNGDPRPWDYKIAFGRISNCTPWTKSGYNNDVGATTEDLWTAGGIYVWPIVAQQMEVLGAAGDTAAGAGVQQVQVGYLDSSYVAHSEIVTMNGINPVATAGHDLFRIQTFRAYRVGGNGVASGSINIRMIGGAATVYSQILAGFTRARNQTWTVPVGQVLYVTSIVFSSGSAAGGKNVLFTTRANYDDANQRVLTPVDSFFMPFHEVLVQDGVFYRELEVPTKLPATVNLKVSALSDSAGAQCTSVLRGFVVTGAIS
jgi:hypothetical protein